MLVGDAHEMQPYSSEILRLHCFSSQSLTVHEVVEMVIVCNYHCNNLKSTVRNCVYEGDSLKL